MCGDPNYGQVAFTRRDAPSSWVMPRPLPLSRLLVLVALGVAVWVAIGTAAPATDGGHTTADEPQYLLTAISLGEDHNLNISDERGDGRYRVFHHAALPLQEKIQPDGTLVSPHDPLLPLVLAVPML